MMSDLRYAWRSCWKRPGFVAAICGTLALGVATVTTIFAFVNSILLNPLPYPKPEELVQICEHNFRQNTETPLIGIPDVMDWKEQSTSFADMAYYATGTLALSGEGEAEPVLGVRISDGFLSALRVKPFLGRWFATEDHASGPDRVCMISYPLWKRRFGSDPQIIGKSLALNGASVTIVGVMPASFEFPESADVALTSGFINWEKWHRDLRWYKAIARLKPGVSLAAAQAELSGIAQRLAAKYPNTNANRDVRLVPLKEQVVGETGRALRFLFAAVCCVLLIACANIASLLVVRAIERKGEFAVRVAVGAGRLQLARQQILESVLLAAAGGALAVLLSLWGVKALVALSPVDIPRLDEVHVDPIVLFFCLAIAVGCGAALGFAPVIQTFRTSVTETLNEESKSGAGSRRTGWARGAILLFQIAITVVLMVGAGLFLRSYARMEAVDLGFKPEHLVVSKIALRTGQYPADWNRMQMFKPLLARLEQLPGKKSVALAARPPFTPAFMVTMGLEGVTQPPGQQFTARFNSVSDAYFETLGMRIVAGRNFNATDTETSPRVVIVNQCLARQYLGSQDPIGRRITVQGNGTNLFTVVGMVNDVHQTSYTAPPQPELYFDCLQINEPLIHVVARVEHAADLNGFANGIKRELNAIDARQAAGNLERFESILGRSLQTQRFRTYLLTCFAAIGLMLSAVGIFGFLSYTVGQRTREIGILGALGAPQSRIVGRIMKDTAVFIVAGLVLGLAGAFAASRLVESFLFEIKATDALTFLLVALFVGVAAAIAAYVPARKATRLEVMTALRA